MLVVAWTVFLFVMLFLLGSAVGSFLNVCIVRLPQGRSLIRPASCCGQCGKRVRASDNIPLLSYWLLRGRCRACGAAFSMRYFWIELLTGLAFVLIYSLDIVCNIHHFAILSWYDSYSEYLMLGMFRPQPWLVFALHALLACFLIVAAMTTHEHHRVPRCVTGWGVVLGLILSLLCPWPWPDSAIDYRPSAIDPMGQPTAEEATPRSGLYPWPIWYPPPPRLPPGSWQLGLVTGTAGVLAGGILMGLVRLAFNAGTGTAALGSGETSLLMIAGGFLGWQPVVVAGLLGLVPGLSAAVMQWAVKKRQRITFASWPALAVAAVALGWDAIGSRLQGLFFNEKRLLLLAGAGMASLLLFALGLRLLAGARSKPGT